ncbi:MAG: hypothetical protein IJ697_09405 [Synergistaceae bacterium]|nr:hypothetical protein [Synergistaceae bacterium]
MNHKKLKFSRFLLVLAAFVLYSAMTAGTSQGARVVVDQDFTLVNHTGETIISVLLSPTGASRWRAEDELGDYVLKHNYEIDIVFSPWDDARYWDIRAEFADGTYDEWYGFDLFTVSEITLNKNGTASYR